LPYPNSERIVQLFQIDKDGKRISVSEPNFDDWKSQTRAFGSMAQSTSSQVTTVNGLSEPARAHAASVSRDFFRVFGLRPELGRTFADDELRLGAPGTVIVSHSFWQQHLDASPAAIGRRLQIGSTLYTVIGVMPAQMDFPSGNELWMPHEIDERNPSRTSHGWRIVARLKDGVTVPQALRDLSTVSRRLKQQYGDATWMSDGDLVTLHEQLVGKIRTTLLVLLGASAFLLLIACANVVNLLVARMTIRRGEIGLRLALGASRKRLAQQFLTEAGVLAVLGGIIGVAIAAGGVRVLLSMQTGNLPRAGEVQLNWPVLAFALLVSIATALTLGLLAVWNGTRGDIRETLSASQRTQAGAGSSGSIRSTLVVTQMALTVVLLVGAGLLARSFVLLSDVKPGFRTEHVVVLDAAIPDDDRVKGAMRRVAFYQDLMTRVRAIPGVTNVGLASGVPLVGGGSDGAYLIMSRIDEPFVMSDIPKLIKDPTRSGYADFYVVDGNYFDTMNIPLVQGRMFNSGDVESAPHVAVVSASLAKTKWPNESAIGKFIQYGNMDGDMRPFTIVGVVGDVRDQSLAAEPAPSFYAYQPQRTHAASNFHVVMQTPGDPTSIISAARGIVRQMRPDAPTVFRTIETVISTSVADRRFVLVLVGVFGGAALLLATLGVYSVISYLVTQRRREIGVRIALGAQRADVLQLVLRQGAALAIAGIVLGGVGALFLTRLLKGLVFGVSTTDPLAFGGVIVLLTAVALLASWVPARRAARVDPMNVLRGS
ncbi:MAG TPA: ABC transporter permease, partial [Gemmatimonadaceae bacterium]|nr:ABC transporter permease [Gemmatimonadaceae bacterium]